MSMQGTLLLTTTPGVSKFAKQLSGAIFALFFLLGLAIAPSRIEAQSSQSGAFVYTIVNPSGANMVDAYRQDPTTGKLTFLASYSTGGLGLPTAAVVATEQNAVIADGHLLYVVNPGSNNISVFRIRDDGSLHLLHSPFPSGGITPVSLALHNHHLLYVANLGDSTTPANYTGFTSHDGFLQPLEGSTISLNIGDAPSDVVFDKSGAVLAGARLGANAVDFFRVGDDGRLTRTAEIGNQIGPVGIAFNPATERQLFAALANLPGDASYSIAPDGSASIVNTVDDPQSIDSCWVVITKDGKRGWFVAPGANSITLLSISPDGALTRVAAHTTLGTLPTEAVLSPSNQFMYVIEISGFIEELRLNGNDIESIETVTVPGAQSSLIGIAFVDFANQEAE